MSSQSRLETAGISDYRQVQHAPQHGFSVEVTSGSDIEFTFALNSKEEPAA